MHRLRQYMESRLMTDPATVTAMTDDAQHVVLDGEREIRFRGQLLGESSSKQPGKTRWIELKIFRTTGGNYIVAGVGRSTNDGETDRCWAHVSESAQGALETMYMYDGDDVRYLTRTAKDAITKAMALDPELRKAYLVETVD
jgi:hypothetical protein